MGSHSAPTVARHAAPAPTARLGRLAGRGAVTASAALALVGAGGGAALADSHDSGPRDSDGVLSDNDVSLLCGLLGGDECSSDSGSRDSDAGSGDDAGSLLDRVDGSDGSDGSYGEDRSEDSDRGDRYGDDASARSGTPSSSARGQGTADQQGTTGQQTSNAAPAPSAPLDTPPPPGQVRTIEVPG